jgi:rRNA maturation endonuclease Nob1
MSEKQENKELSVYYLCHNCYELSELRLGDVCPNCGAPIKPVELEVKPDERHMI